MAELPRNTPSSRMIPLTQWNDYHDWPTVSGMRWYYFNRSLNGLEEARVVCRAGRRLLVDEAAFFRWVRQPPGEARSAAAPCPAP